MLLASFPSQAHVDTSLVVIFFFKVTNTLMKGYLSIRVFSLERRDVAFFREGTLLSSLAPGVRSKVLYLLISGSL